VQRLKSEIIAAKDLLFVTPEYNRSVPGVLKNALDHASPPYGQNAWEGKPAGVLGAAPGSIGTAVAQQHLRISLAYLDVPTLGQPEAFIQVKEHLFDDEGGIGPDSREFLQGWMDRFVAWVKQHADLMLTRQGTHCGTILLTGMHAGAVLAVKFPRWFRERRIHEHERRRAH
jgi:chromate reductase, NAD(P)H dehydrogenase (quinone)